MSREQKRSVREALLPTRAVPQATPRSRTSMDKPSTFAYDVYNAERSRKAAEKFRKEQSTKTEDIEEIPTDIVEQIAVIVVQTGALPVELQMQQGHSVTVATTREQGWTECSSVVIQVMQDGDAGFEEGGLVTVEKYAILGVLDNRIFDEEEGRLKDSEVVWQEVKELVDSCEMNSAIEDQSVSDEEDVVELDLLGRTVRRSHRPRKSTRHLDFAY